MKKFKILAAPVLFLLMFSACSSVQVLSDYDREADFNAYKSYAFYKTGIDKAQISDLDKKRILRAIESEMSKRGGFVKSENPDILVSIFTKEKEQVDIYNNYWGGGGGFGWGGWSLITGGVVGGDLAGGVAGGEATTLAPVQKALCILTL